MEISGLKRKISKLASTNEKEEKHKGVFTDRESYIHIINRMSSNLDDDAIFIGKDYHGEGSGKRKSTGKENIYVRFSQRKFKIIFEGSELASEAFFLALLSGTPLVQVQNGNIDGDELLPLLFREIRKNEGIALRVRAIIRFADTKGIVCGQTLRT